MFHGVEVVTVERMTTDEFPFAVIDPMVSGTIYFQTEAARDAYIAEHHLAAATPGSLPSASDHYIRR